MIPRLNISFPLNRQWCYWFGKQYKPNKGEYLLNHARTGIVMALRAALPKGGRVGVVAYNCHTVANMVVNAGCKPFFMDVTENLRIDVESVPEDLDAIVVTNLFGIRNDVGAIRKRCPGAVVIVDNAHGYGLLVEGDFTVYSINQGKFPALGPGGILVVSQKFPTIDQKFYIEENSENIGKNNKNNNDYITPKEESEPIGISSNNLDPKSAQKQAFGQPSAQSCSDTLTDSSEKNSQKISKNIIASIEEQYAALPGYGFIAQVKLFAQMMVKAVAYSRCMYWLTMKMKKSSNPKVHQEVVMCKMAPGVSRLYNAWLPNAKAEIAKQKRNSEKIDGAFYGDNAFMAIVRTDDPAALKAEYAAKGVETETHFKNAITWTEQFGYRRGFCPKAEELTKKLLMIPTYRAI